MIWDDVCRDRSAPIWVRAAPFLADNDMVQLGELLDQDGHKSRAADLLRILYVANTSENCDERNKDVIEMYETSFGGRDLVADVDFVALYTLLILGDPELVKNEADRMLKKPRFGSGRWNERAMTYLANQTNESERQLLLDAGPFLREREFAYYSIGMVALARGNRDRAMECFNEVIKSGFLDTWFNVTAFAFRERINHDSAWPHWID